LIVLCRKWWWIGEDWGIRVDSQPLKKLNERKQHYAMDFGIESTYKGHFSIYGGE